MFQSNKKDQISPVTRQYLVGRLTMKYQNRRSFWSTRGEGATAPFRGFPYGILPWLHFMFCIKMSTKNVRRYIPSFFQWK